MDGNGTEHGTVPAPAGVGAAASSRSSQHDGGHGLGSLARGGSISRAGIRVQKKLKVGTGGAQRIAGQPEKSAIM